MKVEKNKIIFAGVLAIIFLFLISYSVMLMEDEDNDEQEDCIVEESVTFTFSHRRHHAMEECDLKPENDCHEICPQPHRPAAFGPCLQCPFCRGGGKKGGRHFPAED